MACTEKLTMPESLRPSSFRERQPPQGISCCGVPEALMTRQVVRVDAGVPDGLRRILRAIVAADSRSRHAFASSRRHESSRRSPPGTHQASRSLAGDDALRRIMAQVIAPNGIQCVTVGIQRLLGPPSFMQLLATLGRLAAWPTLVLTGGRIVDALHALLHAVLGALTLLLLRCLPRAHRFGLRRVLRRVLRCP